MLTILSILDAVKVTELGLIQYTEWLSSRSLYSRHGVEKRDGE